MSQIATVPLDIDTPVIVADDDPALVQESSDSEQTVPGGSRVTWFQKEGLLSTSPDVRAGGLIRQICDKSENEEDSDAPLDRPAVPEAVQSTSEAASVSRTPSIEEQQQMGEKLLATKCDHVFVFSDAGKPIYSRHGNEEDFTSHMGVMRTLCSFVHEHFDGDNLKYFSLGVRWCCTFMQRTPLVLVIANRRNKQCTNTVRGYMNVELLNCLYDQIVSVFTYTTLNKMFKFRSNYDLRQLLSGTEKLLDNMLYMKCHEPALFMHAVRCLPLAVNIRDSLHAAIRDSASQMKIQDLVFGLVLARNQLVALVCRKKYKLHPADLHLLLNLVDCNSSSFRNAQHTWTPICLPKFDNTGFLHAHISYLTPESDACLILLTVDRGAFYTLSEMKTKIVERLEKNQMLAPLNEACNSSGNAISISGIGIPLLWHFIYKNRALSQLCVSAFEKPFVEPLMREKLLYTYRQTVINVNNGCHQPNDPDQGQPLRILYEPTHQYTTLSWGLTPTYSLSELYNIKEISQSQRPSRLIAWKTACGGKTETTPNFQLIAVFNPLVSRQSIISKIDKLLRWLKKEDDRLFIMSTVAFS